MGKKCFNELKNMETQNIEYKVKWKDESGGQNAAQFAERQQLILTTIEKHGGHVGGQNGGQKAGLNNEDLAKLLGISLRTIEREVVVLKKKNLIKRIGYGLKGYWAII
jgi:predicted HTH transcriptional regulator